MLADHAPKETCLLFHVERNSRSLLYGHDTGWFPEETWTWLEGRHLDAVILDCTHGKDLVSQNHMGIATVGKTRERLAAMGVLRPEAPVIATHFSHNGGLRHEELAEALTRHGVIAAWDGMVLDLQNGSQPSDSTFPSANPASNPC